MRAELGGEYRIELLFLVGAILAGGCLLTNASAQETVSRIKSAGQVVSGVNVRAGLADLPTGTGCEGLSIDLTKAVAAAVLGDPRKVSFVTADRKSGPEGC